MNVINGYRFLNRHQMKSLNFQARLQFRAMSARAVNYYDILEVSPKASQSQIKAAYYRLSKKYHPDVAATNASEAKEKFAVLSAAYEVLGNPRNRNLYNAGVLGNQTRGGFSNDSSHVDVEYREFVRRRGSFRNRMSGAASFSGQSPMFNFNEFYRQHYGESIRQAQADKKVQEENRRQEEEKTAQDQRLSIVYFTIIILSFFALLKVIG